MDYFDIKLEAFKRGIRIKQLAEELGLTYNQLTLLLNGYIRTPQIPNFEQRVREVFAKWDAEQNRGR